MPAAEGVLLNIFIWWLAIAVIGMVFMPLSGFLFHDFGTGLAVFEGGQDFHFRLAFYVLNAVHLLEFIRKNCILVLAFCWR